MENLPDFQSILILTFFGMCLAIMCIISYRTTEGMKIDKEIKKNKHVNEVINNHMGVGLLSCNYQTKRVGRKLEELRLYITIQKTDTAEEENFEYLAYRERKVPDLVFYKTGTFGFKKTA